MDFIKELNKAMNNFASTDKIVTRVKTCNMECIIDNQSPKCQQICTFDVFSLDIAENKIIMDKTKCINCGFCIDVCPINCFVDELSFSNLKKSAD